VPDAKATREIALRYLKARIPFISLRTSERRRALDQLRAVAGDLGGVPVLVHTMSQGLRDITTGRVVTDERSIGGVLEYAGQAMSQRQNMTFVLTDVPDIEDDGPLARQLVDLVTLATDRGGSVVVVTAGSIWPPLQRLGMTVTFDPPTEDEMVALIDEQITAYRGQLPIEWGDAEFREVASILVGITAIEAENVIATLLAKGSVLRSDLAEIAHAKDRIFSDISGIEKITIRTADLSVGGLAGLRTWLERERPLLTSPDMRERGMRPPRGVLLVGVPGCGKSLSAKAISSSWNLPLYRLDFATIQGQYVGQSENRLKDALATADHVAPCVLWIDEIEKGLAGATGGGDGGVSTRLVGQFLFWLQESTARVFVVATANDVSRLPPELLRRGRFDELFFVDLPTPAERAEIAQLYAHKYLRAPIPDPLLSELVDLAEGFAGADIEAAVKEVAKDAILKGDDSVTDATFRRSFGNIVPLSKTAPEQVDAIRAWGRDRAVPASGAQVAAAAPNGVRPRRSVLA
jgi:ATPase family associated with various cellular activities (AAA)